MAKACNWKVLIVEDEETVRQFIKVYLEFDGLEVFEAANGKEALKVLETVTPDLLVTDIMMPEMDGVALYKALKADKLLKLIPIIVLTVKSSFQDIQQAYLAGVEEYLTKPFDPKLLVDKIREMLSRH